MNEQAAREREALLKRLRELQEEIAQINQQSRPADCLPPEDQFRRNLERFKRGKGLYGVWGRGVWGRW